MIDTITFTCRMPDGTREAVKELAAHNHRSMNAELLRIVSAEPSGSLPANALVMTSRAGDQFQFRIPTDLHQHLTNQAQASGRSLNSEISYRVQCFLHDNDLPSSADERPAPSSSDPLIYRPPPQAAPQPSSRRVYVLPTELVRRIHDYGYEKGHASEVSAVRELLENALAERAKGGEA